MIRIVLIFAGFLSVTIALIMLQPSGPRQTAALGADIPDTDPTVTRQDTALETLTDVAPTPDIDTNKTAAQPTPETTTRPKTETLETMVLSALKQGQSEDYITALVNDAADKGKVQVPDNLITSEGRVDTSALLATLTQSAKPTTYTHTVSPGDTLASISYRYYGRTEHGPAIMAANPDLLPSEAHLTTGQDIVIPKLQ
ncbi:LysM peptidoglycan-binding domain-containing protein [Roseovarius bejariae]|nr:LysM domain-containing protein [Roseovarius bejariae]